MQERGNRKSIFRYISLEGISTFYKTVKRDCTSQLRQAEMNDVLFNLLQKKKLNSPRLTEQGAKTHFSERISVQCGGPRARYGKIKIVLCKS